MPVRHYLDFEPQPLRSKFVHAAVCSFRSRRETSVCFQSEAVVTAQSNDAPCQLRNSLCHAIIEANGSIWNHGHDYYERMQHPNAEWIRNPMFASLRRWKPGKWAETSQPIEATLAEMDQAGVSVAMLNAWHGPSGPMISNDEVAHYCRAHPDRFVGIASVDLYRPMDGVRELRRRVRQDDFKGLRVLPWVWGLPPDDRRYYPLYADELRARHSVLHAGRTCRTA